MAFRGLTARKQIEVVCLSKKKCGAGNCGNETVKCELEAKVDERTRV